MGILGRCNDYGRVWQNEVLVESSRVSIPGHGHSQDH